MEVGKASIESPWMAPLDHDRLPVANPPSLPTSPATQPRAHHSLVRSESAPLNIFDDVPINQLSLDDGPFNQPYPPSRSPPRFPHSASKPPPSRSLSSVELVGFVNPRPAHPPHDQRPPHARPRHPSHSREKSVFDMIQDDFPRTPAPVLSSLFPPEPDPKPRHARLSSTASLDLDLDRLHQPDHDARADYREPALPRAQPPRAHRRSVSVNWTGDFGTGLTKEMDRVIPRSASRTDLPSPRPFFQDPLRQKQVPSSTVGSSPSRPDSPARSPEQTHPTRSGLAPSTPQSTASVMHLPASALNDHPPADTPIRHASPIGALPSESPETFLSPAVDDPVNTLPYFDYHMDRPELQSHSSNGTGPGAGTAPLPDYTSPGYATAHLGVLDNGNVGNMHPVGNTNQYANLFPGVGIFPSPFSNTSAGIGNGVDQAYPDAFRENISAAAADNLKNMSFQMAAFLSAQQHLYAAQMAHAAAMAGNSNLSGLNPFSVLPGGLGPVNNAPQSSVLQNPWDSRDPLLNASRNLSRSRNHLDHLRGGQGHTNNHKRMGSSDIGHKPRAGRNRRGNRSYDEHGLISGHRSDRFIPSSGTHSTTNSDQAQSRSPLLEEFRATSVSIGRTLNSVSDIGVGSGYGCGSLCQLQKGREWQLSEIIDNVVEFATDQHGSRFIQQKLETASAQDKEAILKVAMTDAQRLMMDVFGNYVVQKLLDHGGDRAIKLISEEMKGRMLPLSLHMYGCRVVQKALEVLDPVARSVLVRELDGHVVQCIRDQNGNHVIQKCVELVEPKAMQFIVESVVGQAVVLAGHSYGCRVVQRILEYGTLKQKKPIMVEIMACIADLIKDQYGNYVIQHVVEHGSPIERAVIMNLVRGEVTQLSQHKFASNVVERCLQFGSKDERQVLIEILIGEEGSPSSSPLTHLVRDQFGNYVVQRVLDVAQASQRDRVVTILRAQVPAIKRYSYGKHIIARLENHHMTGGSQSEHSFHSPNSNGQDPRHTSLSGMPNRSRPAVSSASSNEYMFYS